MASLVDPSRSNPGLPTGHPVTNIQSMGYWSAKTVADNPIVAWYVSFLDGSVGSFVRKTDGSQAYSWCVHGPMNADVY